MGDGVCRAVEGLDRHVDAAMHTPRSGDVTPLGGWSPNHCSCRDAFEPLAPLRLLVVAPPQPD